MAGPGLSILMMAVEPYEEDPNHPASERTFYISDNKKKAIYKYNTVVPFLARWDLPQADDLGWVDVDWEKFVYVDLGHKGSVKRDKLRKPSCNCYFFPTIPRYLVAIP